MRVWGVCWRLRGGESEWLISVKHVLQEYHILGSMSDSFSTDLLRNRLVSFVHEHARSNNYKSFVIATAADDWRTTTKQQRGARLLACTFHVSNIFATFWQNRNPWISFFSHETVQNHVTIFSWIPKTTFLGKLLGTNIVHFYRHYYGSIDATSRIRPNLMAVNLNLFFIWNPRSLISIVESYYVMGFSREQKSPKTGENRR